MTRAGLAALAIILGLSLASVGTFAGSAYAPPVTASSVSGLGTAATLDVGTGPSQVVQLTAASKLPAVDGSLLTGLSGGAWDWAQGVPSVTDWPDALAAGAADDVCRSTVLGTGVKIKAGYESDCTTAYGSVDRAVGVLRSVGASDFRVAFRVQLSRPGVARAAGSTALIAGPVFVDGSDAAANSWYGVGLYVSSSTLLTSEHLKLESTAGAARWTTYSAFSGALVTPSWSEVDYVLERVGTDLNIYAAPARGAGFLIATHTVTAGAGLIGLRSQVLFTSADEIDMHLLAYRSGLTELPW